MAVTPVTATTLLERLASAGDSAKTNGIEVEKMMSEDVVTLDDTEQKRALLSGALLAMRDGSQLAVPHERPYHLGSLRVHAGGKTSGCSIMTSAELAVKVQWICCLFYSLLRQM